MIPAVSYLRMSTDAQEASIPAQRDAVKAYATKHGYRILREYVDSGISGDDTAKRVEFQRMLRDAAKGDFKSVLCWNQDRFGRFDLLEAGYWITPLRAAGVSLVTVQQGKIDWNDFAGRLVYSIEQEGKNKFLRDLSWNVNRGKLAKAKAGKWMGGKAPYGYFLSSTATLAIDETQADVVRLIFALFPQLKSLTAVARELNHRSIPGPTGGKWDRCGVSRIIDNILYIGHNRYNRTCASKYSSVVAGTVTHKNNDGLQRTNDETVWTVVENAHPAIVTQEQFDAAAASRKDGNQWIRGRPANKPIVFRGLLKCGYCGKSMYGEFSVCMNDIAYTCASYTGNRGCVSNRTYQTPLLELVRNHITTELLDDTHWQHVLQMASEAASDTSPQRSDTARKTRDSLRRQLEKAESRLLEVPPDMIATVAQRVRDLRNRLAAAQSAVDAVASQPGNRIERIESVLVRFRDSLKQSLNDFSDHSVLAKSLRVAIDHIDVTSTKGPGPTAKGKWKIAVLTIYPRFPDVPL